MNQTHPHRRILVTGAGGYLGPHVVQALVDRGVEVVAVERRSGSLETGTPHPAVERVVGDLFADPDRLFADAGRVDVVLHLAWESGFVHDAPSHMLRLSDHVRFVAAALAAGVRHLAVLGTMHEVGYHHGPIDEGTPTNPRSQYGVAKDALRRSLTLRLAAGPATFQWLRCFYIYGDDGRSSSVFAKIAAAAARGETRFPFTSGRNEYDFIHVDELARQIAATVLQDEVTGVINCCSGHPVALGDQVERFITENALDIRLEYGAFPDRPYDSPAVWGDDTKIRAILELGSRATVRGD